MKKTLALIMTLILVLILLMSMGMVYSAVAETVAQEPLGPPGTVVTTPPTAPDLAPAVVYTTGADPPMVDLTPLLQAVLSLCASLITMFLIPWIRAKYSVEQRQRIAAVYQMIVYAAEQMFGAGNGEKKLQWAIDQLELRGLTVDRALLEEQVKRMTDLAPYILDEPETASTAPPTT